MCVRVACPHPTFVSSQGHSNSERAPFFDTNYPPPSYPILTNSLHRPSFQAQTDTIVNHLYHTGFQNGVRDSHVPPMHFLICYFDTHADLDAIELCRHGISESPKDLKTTLPAFNEREHQHVFQHTYGLHAIILSRSPFLAHLMSTTPPTGGQRVIYVPLDHEPEVTQEVSSFFHPVLFYNCAPILILPRRASLSVAFILNVLNAH